jgi:hypothetical protein
MHVFGSRFAAIGLAAQSLPRQSKFGFSDAIHALRAPEFARIA